MLAKPLALVVEACLSLERVLVGNEFVFAADDAGVVDRVGLELEISKPDPNDPLDVTPNKGLTVEVEGLVEVNPLKDPNGLAFTCEKRRNLEGVLVWMKPLNA